MVQPGEVEREVLERIRPGEEERRRVMEVYGSVRRALEEGLRDRVPGFSVSLQGSVAKDTWLSGNVDLDVFVLFPAELGKRWIKEEALKLLLRVFEDWRYTVRYAEHPYLTLLVDGYEVDVVPALKLTSAREARTAVDRTPFHTEYVNSKLDGGMRDQVRLLKAFMKGIGVYGAEVRVRGFSGYLAELLVIAYGGFRAVLEAASRWKRPVVVDVENHYRGNIGEVLARFPDSPLVVVDPVDPGRNAAAAVSPRRMGELAWAARRYLESPGPEYFFPPRREPGLAELEHILSSSGLEAVFISFDAPSLAPDVLWGEVLRIARRARGVAENWGFRVVEVDAWSDEETVVVAVVAESGVLSPSELVVGPQFDNYEHSERFLAKYLEGAVAGPWIGEDGRWRAVRPRRYRSLTSLLEERHKEYMVAPHFRSVRPRILSLGEAYEALSGRGGLDWLYRTLRLAPPWLSG